MICTSRVEPRPLAAIPLEKGPELRDIFGASEVETAPLVGPLWGNAKHPLKRRLGCSLAPGDGGALGGLEDHRERRGHVQQRDARFASFTLLASGKRRRVEPAVEQSPMNLKTQKRRVNVKKRLKESVKKKDKTTLTSRTVDPMNLEE